MRFLICFFISVFVGFSTSSFAEELLEIPDNSKKSTTPVPKELTLRDAIMLALRYHPNVRNAEIDRVTQKFALEVAKNAFELQYSLTGNINSVEGSGTTSSITPGVSFRTAAGTQIGVSATGQNGTNSGFQQGANINITQPLMRGFGRDVVQAGLMDAYDLERVNKLNFKKNIMTTVTGVIQAYISLRAAENSLVTQELTLKDALNRLEQDRLKVKAGRMAPADLVQVEANFARQQVSILSAKSSLETSRLALLTAIGLDPNTPIKISKDVRLPTEIIPGMKKAAELILKNDVEYQVQLINRAGNQRKLLLAKDALRPQLDATLKASEGSGTGASGQSAGLTFSIPIDNKSLQQSLLQAQVNIKKEEIALKYKKWALESSVLNQLRTLENQKQQVETSIISRDLAKRSLEIAEKKLAFGRATTFETTTLRNQLITAELSAITAQNNYITSIANLQQALGTTLDIWKIEVRY